MFESEKYEDKNLFLLHWTARIFGAAALAILFLFIFGESSDWSKVTAKELVGLLFFPVSLIIGLILAWRKEIWGGLIIVGSIMAFYVVYGWLLNGSFRQGWWFIVFAIPGALFLASGLTNEKPPSETIGQSLRHRRS